MREIITLHLGQAGIQIGHSFWELLCLEHGIGLNGNFDFPQKEQSQSSSSQYGLPNVMFDETRKGKFVSRSCFMDSDPICIDQVKKGRMKQLFHQDRFFTTKQGNCAHFTKGQYDLNENRDKIQDILRKLVQTCHLVQAIVIISSVCGGTGSGYISSILEMCKYKFYKIPIITILVYPSRKYASLIVEPFNTMFAHHVINKQSDANVIITNEKIYDIFKNRLDVDDPNFENVNQMISHVASSITAPYRFQNPSACGISTMLTNTVPYPQLNFLLPSYGPIIQQSQKHQHPPSINQTTQHCINRQNNLTSSYAHNPLHRQLACSLFYRGKVQPLETSQKIYDIKQSSSQGFHLVEWSPTGIQVSYTSQEARYFENQPQANLNKELCVLMNTTSIRPMLKGIVRKYDQLFAKRAFCHWYAGYMASEYFHQARENYEVMLKDYQQAEA